MSTPVPVRVLHVLHYPVFGGPYTEVATLHGPLQERGFQTSVLLTDQPGNAYTRLTGNGVPVERVRLHRLRKSLNPRLQAAYLMSLPADIRRIRRALRQTGAGIVELSGVENPHAAIAGRQEGVAVVWRISGRGLPWSPLRSLAAGMVRRWADAVVTVGEVARYYPEMHAGGLPVIPFYPPVDGVRFDPSRRSGAELRRSLGIPQDAPVVGAVGNINPDKGREFFVRAAALVRARVPSARFLLVGQVMDSHKDLFTRLQRLAGEGGLAFGKDVFLHSPQGDVAEALAAMDVFVQSSVRESISIALLEGMTMARPVVATAVGGTSDVVHDGVEGFVVRPRDGGAMAEAVVKILLDAQAARAMGAAGRQAALARWTVANAADQHATAYRIAMERAAGRRARRVQAADGTGR